MHDLTKFEKPNAIFININKKYEASRLYLKGNSTHVRSLSKFDWPNIMK